MCFRTQHEWLLNNCYRFCQVRLRTFVTDPLERSTDKSLHEPQTIIRKSLGTEVLDET
jgi:hypothetical protein